MELNETLAKVDQTLDSTVKKVEKQAKEMLGKELRIEINKQQQGRSRASFRLGISYIYLLLTYQFSSAI
jgi:hypothetical protein